MQVKDEHIKEFQELHKKETGKDLSWEEASDAAHRILGLAELLFDHAMEQGRREEKLKENPKGFHLDGHYSCAICGNAAFYEESWYDKWGIKCMTCQRAINRRIIPGSCAKKEESWYSMYDLESRFGLTRHMVNKFVKHEILKERIIPNDAGRPHVRIFLIKDNKDTLPPKDMTESQGVSEEKDGKTWFRTEPWYKFVDDPLETLHGYKIANHVRVTYWKEA